MFIKYPRTPHFPFSETITKDDKILKDTSIFNGKNIVITEKMDGENSTVYKNYYHARSISSRHEKYHSWLISYIKNFQYLIPENWRICGEYLFVKHSIQYDKLKSFFLVFSVWNDKNFCLSWEDTENFCKHLGLETVPVLYKGKYDENIVKNIAKNIVENGGEGIVVRLSDSFSYNEFQNSVAKFVRKNHVQTDNHWRNQKIEQNKLEDDKNGN